MCDVSNCIYDILQWCSNGVECHNTDLSSWPLTGSAASASFIHVTIVAGPWLLWQPRAALAEDLSPELAGQALI